MTDPAGTAALQEAIRQMHGCASTFVESVPVSERFQGHSVWEGDVQVFDLIGHPKATRAYVWSYVGEDGERRVAVLLHTRVVNNPVGAVRASIMANWRGT